MPNGIVSTYQYDGLDRLTRLRDAKGITSILDNQYGYDTASQIVQKVDGDGTQSYGHDSLDRLTLAASMGTNTESYTYDAVGNRTTSLALGDHTYESFNRLSEA